MHNEDECLAELAQLQRAMKHHPDAEIKNIERLDRLRNAHTAALCRSVRGLLEAFPDRKVMVLIEAEICNLGCRARPEDAVAWIEGVGVFVLEVKSHTIQGIRSFENNVPQVIYQGCEAADVDLLEQPKDFAYKLKGELEKACDTADIEPPPLYFAGWLPNVAPDEIARLSATVTPGKVWLSDMLQRETFLARLSRMKNLTAGTLASRESLQLFCNLFGCTSGLRCDAPAVAKPFGSLGQLIDHRNLQLKRLTKEQEQLAFNPNLLVGPKVIRGVVGSGKTIVLANAVAETLLESINRMHRPELLDCTPATRVPPVLVLCFNRCLAPYLRSLIGECFDKRKPKSDWRLPEGAFKVINIDRYAHQLASRAGVETDRDRPGETVRRLLEAGCPERQKYAHVFIDEGQDIKLDWYPLIREVVATTADTGPSIIVFYDDAQNVYAVKRPGTGDAPPWKDLLGSVPNPRGLRTIMRVGHRNTNEILTFSYNLLLGAFAEQNPQMAEFAGLAEYEKETIPDDASLDHPRAGQPCVERVDDRQYLVNFAVSKGPVPEVHVSPTEELMLNELARAVQNLVDPQQGNVDSSDGSSNAHKTLRKILIEDQKLDAVISMPSGVFKPYAGVSTAIVLFTKTNSGGTDQVWFYDMQADGNSLDDKRTPQPDKIDLPDILKRWQNRNAETKRKRTDRSFFVPKAEIAGNDYDLSINRYKEVEYEAVQHDSPQVILQRLATLEDEIVAGQKKTGGDGGMKKNRRVPLGDLAEFINGVAFKPDDWSDEGQRIIRIQNLTDASKPYNRTTRVVHDKYHVRPGDLLVSWSATLGVFVWNEPDVALVNQHIFRVIPRADLVHAGYLRQMLIDALIEMERHLHGATMKHVNRQEFLATTIPLPPLAEQQRIAEILDAADALRATRREALAQLDTFLQSRVVQHDGIELLEVLWQKHRQVGTDHRLVRATLLAQRPHRIAAVRHAVALVRILRIQVVRRVEDQHGPLGPGRHSPLRRGRLPDLLLAVCRNLLDLRHRGAGHQDEHSQRDNLLGCQMGHRRDLLQNRGYVFKASSLRGTEGGVPRRLWRDSQFGRQPDRTGVSVRGTGTPGSPATHKLIRILNVVRQECNPTDDSQLRFYDPAAKRWLPTRQEALQQKGAALEQSEVARREATAEAEQAKEISREAMAEIERLRQEFVRAPETSAAKGGLFRSHLSGLNRVRIAARDS